MKEVGRKEKEAARRKAKQEAQQKAPPREQQPRKQQSVPKGKRKGVGVSVKPPRRAAVALTVAPGSGKQCEDALATARGKIHLQDIGVSDVRIRYTVAGGILIEVPGEESATKADSLAAKLTEIFPEDEGI